MYKMNLTVYGILAAFSLLLILWIVPAQTPEPVDYALSPSFMPYLLSIIMLVCSSWLLLKTFITHRGQHESSSVNVKHFLHLLKYVPLFYLTFPLMSWIGFIPAAFIMLCIMQYLTGQRNIPKLVIVSAVVAGFSYFTILHIMHVPLP